MTPLVYLIPIGLVLDIVGFLLVVRYGHALFIHVRSGPPEAATGRDGDLYIEISRADAEPEDQRRRRKAWMGVWVVVGGFAVQIVGSLASILA